MRSIPDAPRLGYARSTTPEKGTLSKINRLRQVLPYTFSASETTYLLGLVSMLSDQIAQRESTHSTRDELRSAWQRTIGKVEQTNTEEIGSKSDYKLEREARQRAELPELRFRQEKIQQALDKALQREPTGIDTLKTELALYYADLVFHLNPGAGTRSYFTTQFGSKYKLTTGTDEDSVRPIDSILALDTDGMMLDGGYWRMQSTSQLMYPHLHRLLEGKNTVLASKHPLLGAKEDGGYTKEQLSEAIAKMAAYKKRLTEDREGEKTVQQV